MVCPCVAFACPSERALPSALAGVNAERPNNPGPRRVRAYERARRPQRGAPKRSDYATYVTAATADGTDGPFRPRKRTRGCIRYATRRGSERAAEEGVTKATLTN